tara:strand:- start:3465 stop:3938 length:474 start_codon:yes stop_codon:yes gene_type:complete
MGGDSTIDKFNERVKEFVKDLKRINAKDKDIVKIELFLRTSLMKEDAILKQFQIHVLRDNLVTGILKQDLDYLISYDFFNDDTTLTEVKSDYLVRLFDRVKTILISLKGTVSGKQNIKNIFEWMTTLIYYAYLNLGIDPDTKMKNLVKNDTATEVST